MQEVKITYRFEVDDIVASLIEHHKDMQDKLMIGFIVCNMEPQEAFDALFAAFGTKCEIHHINKGKKLFEWCEKFDKIEEMGFF